MSREYKIISYPNNEKNTISFSKNELHKNIDKLLKEGTKIICIVEVSENH